MSETERSRILEDKKNLDNITRKTDITTVLNFFEELGVMYNRGLVDKGLIKKFFPTISITYYKYASKWYISGRRE